MKIKGFVEDGGEVRDVSDFAHGWGFAFVWKCKSKSFLKFCKRGWVGEQLVS